jgi:hypothetical protein
MTAELVKRLNARLERAISQFRDQRRTFPQTKNFEERIKTLADRLKLEGTSTPAQDLARRLFGLIRDYYFLQEVSELKIGYIADGLQSSIHAENITVQFALLRSLVEHVSAFSFEVDAISDLVEKLIGQNSPARIDEVVASCHHKIERLFYGMNPAQKSEIRQFHVNDFLKSMAKRLVGIEESYDYLCEFVHPNYGSNLLVSTGRLGAGYLDPSVDAHTEDIRKAYDLTLHLFMQVEDLAATGTKFLMQLDDYLTIAMIPNQRIGSIFNLQPLSHRGDGESKETAIYFTKARTPFESVAMIYRYFEKMGIKSIGLQEIGAIEEDFVFDVIETSKGKLWFRTPMQRF